MTFKRFDYVEFRDLTGHVRQGRIVNTFGKYWGIKSSVTFRYLSPVEISGRIVGYKQYQDFIEYFVQPENIIGITEDPRANKETQNASISQ